MNMICEPIHQVPMLVGVLICAVVVMVVLFTTVWLAGASDSYFSSGEIWFLKFMGLLIVLGIISAIAFYYYLPNDPSTYRCEYSASSGKFVVHCAVKRQ